jgi:2-polyprenyl-3-methyl-5-hydroxy-6-metoxy-1,4-benzoquinol methylase
MKSYQGKKIVHKIEDDQNPSEVHCTTYQMRNFYSQMADGFFSSLDIMNYIQHHKVVTMMKKGDRVLDVCCGRGLLLPLIRYYAKDIREYVGVDISEKNIAEQKRRSGAKLIDDMDSYYPFDIEHIIAPAEKMDGILNHDSFDVIIYTSAIEHMQKEAGYKSLECCYKLMKNNGVLFLSCPNTINKKNPYDTQYAAHLYEWDLDELSGALEKIGFYINDVFGLVGKVRDFKKFIESTQDHNEEGLQYIDIYNRFKEYLPTPWLMAIFPILFPEAAAEVAIIASKTKKFKRMKGLIY